MGIRILGIQLCVRAGDPDTNAALMIGLIKQYAAQFDLIVFSEMVIPGYFLGDAWERSAFLDRCEAANARVIAASTDTAIIFGSVGRDTLTRGEDGRPRLYNAAYVAQWGKPIAAEHIGLPFWPKTLLPNYRVFDDTRHFYDLRRLAQERGQSIGDLLRPAYLELKAQNDGSTSRYPSRIAVGITICEDMWSDDYAFAPFAHLAEYRQQAHVSSTPPLVLCVNLSASPYTKGKHKKRHRIIAARQNESRVPVLYVNNTGIGNNGKNLFCFDGASAVCDASGLYECPSFIESTLPFELSIDPLDAPQADRAAVRLLGDSTEYRRVTKPELAHPNPKNGDPSSLTRGNLGDETERVARALIYCLAEACETWSISNIVIGASGGVDSSLVAALFCAALGRERVTLINMPSRYSSRTLQNAAADLAQRLGTKYHVFGIEDSVAQLRSSLAGDSVFAPLLHQSVLENIQARDRGRILAAAAAALSGVFSCNANKSELMVGYGTLYGDIAGFLAPLGDLWKTEVYALARYLNTGALDLSQSGFKNWLSCPPIPDATLQAPPSAELSAEHDVDAGLGDPLCYVYHDSLFRLWTEAWLRENLESTIALYDTGLLAKRLGLEPPQLPSWFDERSRFVADCQLWWKLYTGLAAFKRVQSPPVVSLSRRALGFDHRESVGLRPVNAPL